MDGSAQGRSFGRREASDGGRPVPLFGLAVACEVLLACGRHPNLVRPSPWRVGRFGGNTPEPPVHFGSALFDARPGVVGQLRNTPTAGPVRGQNDTDMLIEMVRGAPSHAAFSTIAARYDASKRLFATSDTSADSKRSDKDSTENVR